MRQKLIALISSLAILSFVLLPASLASAQAPSLQEQLSAQYKLVKMGSDSSGYSVTEEGTLLSVQKGGIIGVPYKNMATRTATFKDGVVHASDPTGSVKNSTFLKAGCGLLHKCPNTPDTVNDETTTKLFKVGDKVYPAKIAVDPTKDTVTINIVACDTCNKTDPPTYNKAQVVFQFAKGSLATAAAGPVEDTIGQLLAVSTDDQQGGGQQGGNDQQGGNQQGGGDQGGGQAQQQQAPPPEPQQIGKGQTPDQVKAALGQPDKIVNLGTKQIWVYKDLKVTFVNGQVSDVQ
jgi:hypothetical protein